MAALTGVEAVGTLDGELSLDIPTSGPQGGQPDLSQASGACGSEAAAWR